MTTCRIIQVRRSRPPYERYMTTNRCIHAAATPRTREYDDESRYPAAAAHPITCRFRFPVDNANVLDCSKIELNTLRENGSRDHIFFSSVAKQAHNFIRGAGSSPEEA
ncbi:hypothetical protein TcYC6_0035770 [Trypanosoma cruzi]|nr:hypothetical protein TcYC6_0035770 [Trypanosoma cruzi]